MRNDKARTHITKIIIWGAILMLSLGGFFWNCTFLMDTTKYPDRFTCGVNQYVNATTYIMTKYTDYLKAKMEKRIERKQESLSGAINKINYHDSGAVDLLKN